MTRFDQARVAAGDIYLDAASGRAVTVARTTHISWQNRSTEPAKQAVDALCAAMPEVVVLRPQRPPAPSLMEIPTDLAPTPDPTTPWWKTGLILAILGLVIYFCIRA